MDILGILLTLLLPLLEKLILWLLGLGGDASKVTAVNKAKLGVCLTRFGKIGSKCTSMGIFAQPDPEGDKAEADFTTNGTAE